MMLSLMLTVSSVFGIFARQNLPDAKSPKINIINYKISHGEPVFNKWFTPTSSKDLTLYKHVVLSIDDGLFPNATSEEVHALDPNDEYTNAVLKALLELSELPKPINDGDAAKYTRGPFTRPTDNITFTIRRVADQRYKMDIQSPERYRRSAEEDVGDEEADHQSNKKKPKSSSKNENETKKNKKDKADGGRIVGGVSSLQFTNVNNKFRSALPG